MALLLQVAKGYLSKCHYPQALLEVKKALDVDEESFLVHDSLGVIYYLMKQYDQSTKHFLQAISLTPSYTQAKVNLAQVLIKQKRIDEALVLLKQAEADLTYAHPSQVHLLIGEVFVAKRSYTQASKYLSSSRQMSPKNCSLFLNLGKISFHTKKYQQAVRYFEKTQECFKKRKDKSVCAPAITDHYYLQALGEIQLKQNNKAIRSLNLFLINTSVDHPRYSSAKKLLSRIRKEQSN